MLSGMALATFDLTLERVRARVLFSFSAAELLVFVDELRLADLVRMLLVVGAPELIGGDILLLVALTLLERLLCSLAWQDVKLPSSASCPYNTIVGLVPVLDVWYNISALQFLDLDLVTGSCSLIAFDLSISTIVLLVSMTVSLLRLETGSNSLLLLLSFDVSDRSSKNPSKSS